MHHLSLAAALPNLVIDTCYICSRIPFQQRYCAVFSDEKDIEARSIWLTISCLSSGSLINDDISLLISDSAMDLDVSFPETKIH